MHHRDPLHASRKMGQVRATALRLCAAPIRVTRRGPDTSVHRTSISVIVHCSGSSQLPSCGSRTHPRPQVLSEPVGIRSAIRSQTMYDEWQGERAGRPESSCQALMQPPLVGLLLQPPPSQWWHIGVTARAALSAGRAVTNSHKFKIRLVLSPAETFRDPIAVPSSMQLLNVGASDAAAPSSVGKPGLRVCGVTRNVRSRPRCSDIRQRSRRLR